MKKHQDAKAQIHELIDRLSTNHILKNSPQSYVHDFVTAGRLPDYLKTYEEMKQTIESGTSGIRFVLGKNRDRTSQAVREGLGIFKHYLSEFSSFPCSTLILDEHTEQREGILRTLKVNRFVGQHLDNETRARYFPVHVNS